MYRHRNRRLAHPVIFSILLHIFIFACGSISYFMPKKENMLLMDIEIAGEGELQDTIDKQEEIRKQPSIEENNQQKIIQESSKKEEPHQQEENVPTPVAENKEETTTDKDDQIAEEIKEKTIEKQQEETTKEDNHEEPIPKIEEKKKPKTHKKKAVLDVIKKVEKAKAKGKIKKKILEIAEKAAKKKKDESFDKMLSGSISDFEKTPGKGKKNSGVGSFGSGNGLTESDYEMISSQIYPHWAVPSGVREAENIIIEIQVQLKENGEVIPSGIKILDENRYATDYIFRAAADSARRAILEASPLKIPKDKIDLFLDFIFRFNLKEALGG